MRKWLSEQRSLMSRRPKATIASAALLAFALLLVVADQLYQPEVMALWRGATMGSELRFDDLVIPLQPLDNVFQSPSLGEIVQRPGLARRRRNRERFAFLVTVNPRPVQASELEPLRANTARVLAAAGCRASGDWQRRQMAGEPLLCDRFACDDALTIAQCTGERHSVSFRGTPEQLARFYSLLGSVRKAQ